ncbi:unnamed protein product [Ilex paraguariensis]|uniref:Uncharacterized protein n=1 Tax=Ilex paraguariensis TaxID=185542 RepID=A0ABC8RX93_9AQUA
MAQKNLRGLFTLGSLPALAVSATEVVAETQIGSSGKEKEKAKGMATVATKSNQNATEMTAVALKIVAKAIEANVISRGMFCCCGGSSCR